MRLYHDALLTFMGFDDFPAQAATWSCQLLLLPTFQQTAVLRVVGEPDAAHIELAILNDSEREYELFELVWQTNSVEPIPETFHGTANLSEELVVLGEPSRSRLADELRITHGRRLSDHIAQNTRDGLVVRCDLLADLEHQQFVLHGPQDGDSAGHHAFVGEVLRACRASTELPVLEEYLKTIEQYLGVA